MRPAEKVQPAEPALSLQVPAAVCRSSLAISPIFFSLPPPDSGEETEAIINQGRYMVGRLVSRRRPDVCAEVEEVRMLVLRMMIQFYNT